MSYDLDLYEKGKNLLHIKKFFLHPEFWIDSRNKLPINLIWKKIKFSEFNKGKIPTNKGLYAFVLEPKVENFFETNYLFYIGKTNRTLKVRFSEYIADKKGKGKPRPKVFQMIKQYGDNLYFYYCEINNSSDVDVCEENLLNTFIPHVNTSIPDAKIKPELKYIYEN